MKPSNDKLEALAKLVISTAPEEIDCGVFLERVAEYLEITDSEGKLPSELLPVRQHLEVCPECLEEFEVLVSFHRGS